jgi:hypothetical protein
MIAVMLAWILAAPPADVIDRIMATIGAQPITLSDVSAAMQFQLVDVPAGTPDPTGYVLDRLIERSLMLTEVDRFQPPEPDESEIATRIGQMEARAGSAAAFDQSLAVTGMTRDQLRRFVRDNLRIATYQAQRFGAVFDPREHDAAIAAWIADLRRRAEVNVLYRDQPRGVAPRTPPHALSRAASPARSVRVAHSLSLVRASIAHSIPV